mgnify:CR=1 FL=1
MLVKPDLGPSEANGRFRMTACASKSSTGVKEAFAASAQYPLKDKGRN